MTFHCQLNSMNLEAQAYMSMGYLEFCLEKMEHIGQEARGAARRWREETSAKARLPLTYYISQISNHSMMIRMQSVRIGSGPAGHDAWLIKIILTIIMCLSSQGPGLSYFTVKAN